jgi:hypothetical protein
VFSEAGNVDACKLLIECQADVNVKDYELCDALPLHILLKTKAGLRFCFERCNSCPLCSGQTALHLSSMEGHVEVCKLLIECQADVNLFTKVNACEYGAFFLRFDPRP